MRLVNITTRAALVESDARLRPGAVTELQLAYSNGRASIRGRLDRCYVAALEPLRYRGLVVFDERIEFAVETSDAKTERSVVDSSDHVGHAQHG